MAEKLQTQVILYYLQINIQINFLACSLGSSPYIVIAWICLLP